MFNDVSEERITSLLVACVFLIYTLAYSYILRMEAKRFSEKSLDVYQNTQLPPREPQTQKYGYGSGM
jgi:hypothetical protein